MTIASTTESMDAQVSVTPPSRDCASPENIQESDSNAYVPSSPVRRPTKRPLLRASFKDFSGVVSILVGGNTTANPATRYLMHKELCTAASPFFAAAFDGKFVEASTQSIHLPEERPEIFEWFLQWLYTGSLTTPLCGENARHPCYGELQDDGELRNSAGSPKYFLLLDLWALSDRLLTTELSNLVLSTIARLAESTNSVPTPSDTWILYDSIPEHSGLRELILDLFAYKKTDRLLETHTDEWHPQFLRDLVVKLKRPGPEAIERHTLIAWTPRSWPTTKACEGCRQLLKPHVVADKCCVCDKAFCAVCLYRYEGEGQGRGGGHDMSGCKPWAGRGMCMQYHDHLDDEKCVR